MNPYYLLVNDVQTGPFTLSQMQSMWGNGTITTETLFWQEGEPEWLAASTIVSQLEPPKPPLVPSHTLSVTAPQMLRPPPMPAPVRTCLFCAEPIAEAAMKCRHCGEILDPRLRAAEEANRAAAIASAMPRHAPQTIQQSVIVQNIGQKHSFPHVMHFVVTVFCLGCWLPIWILHYLFRDRHYYY